MSSRGLVDVGEGTFLSPSLLFAPARNVGGGKEAGRRSRQRRNLHQTFCDLNGIERRALQKLVTRREQRHRAA